jgi:hypothetical protein
MATERYQKRFALLTLHGKEKVIAPLLAEHFNASLTLTQAFDTDSLGMFSGEIERQLSPHECALKKAVLACELTGLTLGLGSEGSFGPGPYGFGVFNHEVISCYHQEQDWSVTGHYSNFSSARSDVIEDLASLDKFLIKTPADQALIVKSSSYLEKGIYGANTIRDILTRWFGYLSKPDGNLHEPITLSYDLRAHHCPERRIHISKACEDLIARLKSPCPECKTPGFWPDKSIPGLICCGCGGPTNCTKARIAVCTSCQYSETTPVADTFAKQEFCDYCNP